MCNWHCFICITLGYRFTESHRLWEGGVFDCQTPLDLTGESLLPHPEKVSSNAAVVDCALRLMHNTRRTRVFAICVRLLLVVWALMHCILKDVIFCGFAGLLSIRRIVSCKSCRCSFFGRVRCPSVPRGFFRGFVPCETFAKTLWRHEHLLCCMHAWGARQFCVHVLR